MSSDSVEKMSAAKEYRVLAMRFYSELARYSTWLFGAVIVAMTFLLLAGLRSPKMLLLVFMYVALGSFALSLLSYLLSNMLSLRQLAGLGASSDKDKDAKDSSPKAAPGVKVFQVLQQVLFVVALIAMVGFAIEVALLFFPAAGAATQSSAGAQ